MKGNVSHISVDDDLFMLVELLYAVCRVCGHDDCGALLAQETALLESIFNYLKSFLTKENWQNCPVHKQTLVWCALHLKV